MEQKNDDYAVLVHGLGRSSNSMRKIEKALEKCGYKTINLNYPSRSDTIENLSENYLAEIIKQACTDIRKKIHFVTHSMGAMMVRYYLSKNTHENLGKLVMLAPPSKGSIYADKYSKYRISPYIFGRALRQMTSEIGAMPNTLPEPYYEVGVIAGLHDGKVTIEQTKLDSMKDFLIVPENHTFIMDSRITINAIKDFFENGEF